MIVLQTIVDAALDDTDIMDHYWLEENTADLC